MAFDGIVISALAAELKQKLVGGRIMKISQPEKEELILTIKNYDQYRLFLSVGAGMPLVYLTEQNKPSPLTAPNFCMLLRKHFNSARILDVEQPEFERTLRFKIEHLNEMGDRCIKYLIIEVMGKHSNIILCDEGLTIVDSIRHISGMVSSVREVLPGRVYFIPKTEDKKNPLEVERQEFIDTVLSRPLPAGKAVYQSLTGISPLIANELLYRASLDADRPSNTLNDTEKLHLAGIFSRMTEDVKEQSFHPAVYYQNGEPAEFSVLELRCYEALEKVSFDTVSAMLETYYSDRNASACIKQRSTELRKTVANIYERAVRKLDLQRKQLSDTEGRDKYKIYGELLTTYGYEAASGDEKLTVVNYYNNEEITIPLDPQLSAIENAKHYFEKYSKQKRTAENLDKLIAETKDEVQYLDSVRTALDIAAAKEDLLQIREELAEGGYLKKRLLQKKGRQGGQSKKVKNGPYHFISSDGFDIYVGKNNLQNEELSFKLADGNDWWFHAKGIPGSHVIVKTHGKELPDRVYEEAGACAAYYSSGRGQDKVEVDYTLKKNLKKPGGSRPGFVVYYTNYSLMADGRRVELNETDK